MQKKGQHARSLVCLGEGSFFLVIQHSWDVEIDYSNLLIKNEERVEKVGNITWHCVDTRWEICSDGIWMYIKK